MKSSKSEINLNSNNGRKKSSNQKSSKVNISFNKSGILKTNVDDEINKIKKSLKDNLVKGNSETRFSQKKLSRKSFTNRNIDDSLINSRKSSREKYYKKDSIKNSKLSMKSNNNLRNSSKNKESMFLEDIENGKINQKESLEKEIKISRKNTNENINNQKLTSNNEKSSSDKEKMRKDIKKENINKQKVSYLKENSRENSNNEKLDNKSYEKNDSLIDWMNQISESSKSKLEKNKSNENLLNSSLLISKNLNNIEKKKLSQNSEEEFKGKFKESQNNLEKIENNKFEFNEKENQAKIKDLDKNLDKKNNNNKLISKKGKITSKKLENMFEEVCKNQFETADREKICKNRESMKIFYQKICGEFYEKLDFLTSEELIFYYKFVLNRAQNIYLDFLRNHGFMFTNKKNQIK